MTELVTIVHYRAKRERDGTFAVLRIERAFNRHSEPVRESAAIVSHGFPCRRAATQAAQAAHRMREIAAP